MSRVLRAYWALRLLSREAKFGGADCLELETLRRTLGRDCSHVSLMAKEAWRDEGPRGRHLASRRFDTKNHPVGSPKRARRRWCPNGNMSLAARRFHHDRSALSRGGLSMNKLSPRKIAAIVAAVGLLGLAAVALKQARRPALVVIENEETDSSYQDGSIHGGDCLSCETDVEGPVAGSVTPELDDDLIVIHVAGAVARPEVYSLPPHGSRVADAVRAAGEQHLRPISIWSILHCRYMMESRYVFLAKSLCHPDLRRREFLRIEQISRRCHPRKH